MLPRLRVLQVGDVHYPSASIAVRSVDDKDVKFPVSLKGRISSLPLKAVIKRIHAELCASKVDALLFMGDLTDQGNLSGFESCATYLMDALELRAGHQFENIPTGFVPGNHDIDRTLAISRGIVVLISAEIWPQFSLRTDPADKVGADARYGGCWVNSSDKIQSKTARF